MDGHSNLWITPRIMCIDAKKMSHTVRHKDSPQPCFHHIINFTENEYFLSETFAVRDLVIHVFQKTIPSKNTPSFKSL